MKKVNFMINKDTGNKYEYGDVELSSEEEKRFYKKALATKILGKKNYNNNIQCNHLYKYSHQETKQTNSTGCNQTVYDVVVCEKCGDIKRNQVFNY